METRTPARAGELGRRLFRSFPRKGMETSPPPTQFTLLLTGSFPIISPQGDGNNFSSQRSTCKLPGTFPIISPQGDGNHANQIHRLPMKTNNFSDHFPARGWKQFLAKRSVPPVFQAFPIISPQGDGNDIFSYIKKSMSGEAPFPIISPQGDGNKIYCIKQSPFRAAFPIISPQGDGNKQFGIVSNAGMYKLFRSFPRKGMETPYARF